MNPRGGIALFLIIVFLAIIAAFFILKHNQNSGGGAILNTPANNTTNTTPLGNTTIFIDNATQELVVCYWNIQIFGVSKASNPDTMNAITTALKQCDIGIVQEIRDETGTAWQQLCGAMQGYACQISTRLGRSTSKEQYGLLYRTNRAKFLSKTESEDYELWERPPTAFKITDLVRSRNLTLIVSHTKPDDATSEIIALVSYAATHFTGNVMFGGDLNADCSYYLETRNDFSGWYQGIPNEMDTTVAPAPCTYDRIYANFPITGGIYSNVTSTISDHYMVLARF